MSKILAVGDIHTKQWIIDLVKSVVDDYDAVVFVGDYVDNWGAAPMQSIATWHYLKAFMLDNPKVHAVIGNHDFAYIHPEIAGRSSGWNPVTYALLNSPENDHLKKWLLTLPVMHILDGVHFTHAGITQEWNGEYDVYSLWADNSPIWARPREFGGYVKYKNIPQVIGHNPSEKIWNPAENVWCIDTFSEHRDNSPIGDFTVLEITDGKKFKPIKLKQNANNNNSSSFEAGVSRQDT